MGYYAFIDSNSIVTWVGYLPSTPTDSAYIYIGTTDDQTLIGKKWTGTEFVEVTHYYYALLNDKDVVVEVYEGIEGEASTDVIAINSLDTSIVGKWYDRENQVFTDPPIHVLAEHSTDVINVGTQDKWLTTKINEIDLAVSAKAPASHTHTGEELSGVVKTINGSAPDSNGNISVSVSGGGMTANEILTSLKTVDGAGSGLDADTIDGIEASAFALADHTHTGYAATDHTHSGYATVSDMEELETAVNGKADSSHNHDTAYAAINHTHTGYASSDHTHTGYATAESVTALENSINGKANSDHTHTQEDITGLATALNGKASENHTHTQEDVTGLATALAGKANASHTHSEYATSNHTHSGYAATNHTHSVYASSSHTHSDYLSTSGGTLSGTLNVNAAIKSNGVQVGYNSGSDTTLGSNSYPTNVAGTQVTLNGDKVYSPNIYPRNTGTFYLGAQSNRWSGIYSKVAVNVSSDERLKEGIKDVDVKACVDFVNALEVKNFSYIGNETEQIGVIAQQLVAANPDFAKYFVEQGEDGYYGVKTSDLVFPLIAAVQKLSKEIEQLKK